MHVPESQLCGNKCQRHVHDKLKFMHGLQFDAHIIYKGFAYWSVPHSLHQQPWIQSDLEVLWKSWICRCVQWAPKLRHSSCSCRCGSCSCWAVSKWTWRRDINGWACGEKPYMNKNGLSQARQRFVGSMLASLSIMSETNCCRCWFCWNYISCDFKPADQLNVEFSCFTCFPNHQTDLSRIMPIDWG